MKNQVVCPIAGSWFKFSRAKKGLFNLQEQGEELFFNCAC